MRICMIGDGWFPDHPGGLNRYLRSLFEALDTAELKKEAIVLGPAADAPSSVHVATPSSSSLRTRIRETARALPADPDLIDVHFAPTALSRR